MFAAPLQLQMKTFQRTYMENQIISAIQSSSNFRDLLPYIQNIMDLENMKKILISELHNVSNPPKQSSPKSELPSKQSTSSIESIRSIYLNCSSLEEILPEPVNLKIFSFIQNPNLRKFLPTLSTYFHSLACKYHLLYRGVSKSLNSFRGVHVQLKAPREPPSFPFVESHLNLVFCAHSPPPRPHAHILSSPSHLARHSTQFKFMTPGIPLPPKPIK